MGNFIGDLGGILMIALIIVLAFRFVWDIIDKKGEAAALFMKDFIFYAVSAVALFAAVFFIGGIMFNHAYGASSLFEIEIIWNKGLVQDYLVAHKYSFSEFAEKGILPLFPVLVSFFSGLLFDMYVECGFYISVLCGVITTVSLGFVLRKRIGRGAAAEYILLFLCMPAMMYIFMPSAFAMFMALCSLVMLGIVYEKKWLTIIFTALCLITHVYGLAVLAMVIASFVCRGNKRNIITAGVFSAALLVLGIIFLVMGYVCIYEMWFVYVIPACLVLPKVKENSNIIKYVAFGMILINSMYMTGLIYNAF